MKSPGGDFFPVNIRRGATFQGGALIMEHRHSVCMKITLATIVWFSQQDGPMTVVLRGKFQRELPEGAFIAGRQMRERGREIGHMFGL